MFLYKKTYALTFKKGSKVKLHIVIQYFGSDYHKTSMFLEYPLSLMKIFLTDISTHL